MLPLVPDLVLCFVLTASVYITIGNGYSPGEHIVKDATKTALVFVQLSKRLQLA
jgi:hypothetical protein